MDDARLYSMAEAARLKGVSYHTVSRAVRRGKLPARRLGGQALIAAADLAAWTPQYGRTPRKYRHRHPDPGAAVAPLDAAALDRVALGRQVAVLAARIVAAADRLAPGEVRRLRDRLAALAAELPP